MKPGTVLDERFEIEREIGFGGMGTVYRALDRRTSAPVAVKLLRIGAADDRFAREIATLAELSHPRIVRYIESGTAPDGARYLAMEWLEGEDLAARLVRAPITITESLELIRHVSEALAAAHRRGIIHRDIKPSNLFLPGNDLAAVKLLDFGIARRTRDRAMTRTGAVLGTPEYMAPEQARGDRTLDARVDVFALGCVLFECIAGYPPFAGDNVMAVLAKILLDEPPRLSEVRSGVACDLDTLVAAMLSKDPNARPADATAVIAACGQAALAVGNAGDVAPHAAPSLTHAEQRVVCVVLAAAVSRESAATEIAETLVAGAMPAGGPDLEFAAYGARVAPLADGSVLALIAGDGTAVDHATRAAHCALAMRTRNDQSRVRGGGAGREQRDQVVDRGAADVLVSQRSPAEHELGHQRRGRAHRASRVLPVRRAVDRRSGQRRDRAGDAGGVSVHGEGVGWREWVVLLRCAVLRPADRAVGERGSDTCTLSSWRRERRGLEPCQSRDVLVLVQLASPAKGP